MVPLGRNRQGAQALKAVFPSVQGRKSASAVKRPAQKRAASRPGVRVGMGAPVKLQARRGGGVEAVLRREMSHVGRLSARDYQRLRFLLGRAEMAAKMQSPRGRGRRGLLQKKLAAAWGTRLVRDERGVSLVLENRSDHALYLAMGTRRLRPRAVFKSALAAQQGAIDSEWQRLARVAQMRDETRGQLRAGIDRKPAAR